MNQITKDVKTHVAITFNGNKYYITAEQNKKLQGLDDKARITVDGNLIRVSTICEVLPIDKYLDNHPNERPAIKYPEVKTEPMTPWTKARYLRALNSMLRGLEKYIGEREEPSAWSLDHREKLIAKIKKVEQEPDTGKYSNPITESAKALPVQPYGGKA